MNRALPLSGGDRTHKASSHYPERPPVLKNRASQCFNTDQPLTVSTSLEGRMAMTIISKQYIRRKCDPVEAERIWQARGGVKACTKCGHVRQRDQFKPVTKAKDGASCECKDCRSKHERTKRAPLVKYSAPRKKVQPSDYGEIIWRSIEISNAHDAWAWWLDNAPSWWVEARVGFIKAKTIDASRASWRAAKHIKRAVAAGVHVDRISAADLEAIRSRPDCHWCGVAVTKYDGIEWQPTDATIEHVIPLSEGGPHSLDNIVCACARCNFGRGDSNWSRLLAS